MCNIYIYIWLGWKYTVFSEDSFTQRSFLISESTVDVWHKCKQLWKKDIQSVQKFVLSKYHSSCLIVIFLGNKYFHWLLGTVVCDRRTKLSFIFMHVKLNMPLNIIFPAVKRFCSRCLSVRRMMRLLIVLYRFWRECFSVDRWRRH